MPRHLTSGRLFPRLPWRVFSARPPRTSSIGARHDEAIAELMRHVRPVIPEHVEGPDLDEAIAAARARARAQHPARGES